MIVSILFNKRYFGGVFNAPKVKKMVRMYGGSIKKNKKFSEVKVSEEKMDLFLFMLDHKYGVRPIEELC